MMYYHAMNYMEVLKQTDSMFLSFECEWPCMFLETLTDDGYDEFLKIQAESQKSNIHTGSRCEVEVGDIYILSKDADGKIIIHRDTPEKYSVSIQITGRVTPKRASSFDSAIAVMSGKH